MSHQNGTPRKSFARTTRVHPVINLARTGACPLTMTTAAAQGNTAVAAVCENYCAATVTAHWAFFMMIANACTLPPRTLHAGEIAPVTQNCSNYRWSASPRTARVAATRCAPRPHGSRSACRAARWVHRWCRRTETRNRPPSPVLVGKGAGSGNHQLANATWICRSPYTRRPPPTAWAPDRQRWGSSACSRWGGRLDGATTTGHSRDRKRSVRRLLQGVDVVAEPVPQRGR